MMLEGAEWAVTSLTLDRFGKRRGDGDTCWITRSTVQLLGDTLFRVEDLTPVAVRLVWVDTPERGEAGYRDAQTDLTEWLQKSFEQGPVKVVIYEDSAGWDRLLGNIINSEGESASQYLMTVQGWPPYEKDK